MEAIVEECFCNKEETLLTVLKTSVFFAGDGFAVYDPMGQLLFRVDSYGGPDNKDDRNELFLMDASGKCLLTVRRKRPSLHNRWEGFIGEKEEGDKPIFSVRRSSIIGSSSVTVEVYNKRNECEYLLIEGSFSRRCCTVYKSASREAVAEIKRKVATSSIDDHDHVMLGKDVFCLCLMPRFDSAFAMGLVLVLDQIAGEPPFGDGEEQLLPTSPTS